MVGFSLSHNLCEPISNVPSTVFACIAAALKKSLPPPAVPARGDSVLTKKPPEIPPKRQSLKNADGSPSKQPPPLPQKPGSAKSSPLVAPKFPDKPAVARPIPPTPQMANKFDRPPANMPAAALVSTNPFDSLSDSVNSNQMSNQNSLNGSPQLSHSSLRGMTSTASSSSASSKHATPLAMKKQLSADHEDFGSEDALRGIESGLRNMERAMQEQMNIRSLEAAAHAKSDKRNFNTIDFKRNIGGSVTSLDGGASVGVTGGPMPNMSVIESMRLALGKSMRSMERGQSMDQMRMDQMHLTNNMRALEANANNVNGAQRPPLENHMKSLDRSLPLELQYSRHHHRSQPQQEPADPPRQNIANPTIAATAAISREDLRLRRRSSHDENQMAQIQNNNAGKMSAKGSGAFWARLVCSFATGHFRLPYVAYVDC